MSEQTKKEYGKKTGWVVGISVVVVLILLVAGLMAYAAGYQEIFPNTYIGECKVGGMTKEEATEYLGKNYRSEDLSGNVIVLSCKGNKTELALDEIEMQFDPQASAEAALVSGERENVLSKTWGLVKSIFAKNTLVPNFSYDKEKLEEAVLQVAGQYETEPKEYTYEVTKDQVTLYNKKNGKKVDREELVRELERRIWQGDFSELELNPVAITPEPWKAKELYKSLTAPVADAEYEKGEDGAIVVKPGKYQCQVSLSEVEEAIAKLKTSGKEKVTIKVTTKAPKNTTEDLTAHLYQDVLGEYTTYYSGTAARNSNVQLATGRVNGIELMPEEEFSYDKTILSRIPENGYQAAPVYVGNKVESGMGGGICQPSSTLYGAVLYANLEVLERHNHSMMVSYMPAGLDATIAEGFLDLRFKNSSKYPIKIEGVAQNGKLTFRILGYNPENISVELIRTGGGFHYSATRVVSKDGKEISREDLGPSRYSPKEEEPKKEEEKAEENPENPEGTEEVPQGEQPGGEVSSESAPAEAVPTEPVSAEPAPAPVAIPQPEVVTE